MSEQTNPSHIDRTSTTERLSQQQNALREMVETHATIPASNYIYQNFQKLGLVEGEYDMFTDSRAPLFECLTKIVSKEDPSDISVGVSWPHIGGNVERPNRYLNDFVLRSDGHIIGRVSVENDYDEPKIHEIDLPPNSTDPDIAQQYQRRLELMRAKAEQQIAPPPETSHPITGAESASRTAMSRLRSLLGRFSLG